MLSLSEVKSFDMLEQIIDIENIRRGVEIEIWPGFEICAVVFLFGNYQYNQAIETLKVLFFFKFFDCIFYFCRTIFSGNLNANAIYLVPQVNRGIV
ncbi:hypothetical protein WL34_25135 [Burkholderia cepacia]|nr:hypothetical protein WL34_25135 [Burkholderia cepacia]